MYRFIVSPTPIPLITWFGTAVAFVLTLQGSARGKPGGFDAGVRTTMTTTMTMKELPTNVVKYSQVPKSGVFTADKIPCGLLKEHATKEGTWGVIRVSQGQLRYQINEHPIHPPSVYILDSEKQGIIEPQVKHEVAAMTEDVAFVVEFHRQPGSGTVDEKREGL